MQITSAVESIGGSEGQSQSQSQLAINESTSLRAAALSGPWLNNPDRDAEEVLRGVVKITQRAMVNRRSYRSI